MREQRRWLDFTVFWGLPEPILEPILGSYPEQLSRILGRVAVNRCETPMRDADRNAKAYIRWMLK